MTAIEVILILISAGLAGILGGMLGVGGSTILIPALTLVLGPDQHLYQAAAMTMNIAVAVPSTLRHRRAGVLMPGVLKWMLPTAVVAILVGVWVSNLGVFSGSDGGLYLRRMLAVFLVYVIGVNMVKLWREVRVGRDEEQTDDGEPIPVTTPARSGLVGGAMGMIAGLLGIGGGALAVPMQQSLLKLPLRNAIGNSAAVMCVSSIAGAIYKNATLGSHGSPEHPLYWWSGLAIAALVIPIALISSRYGAGLTHRLPLRAVRVVFIGLMIVAAWRMFV